MVKKNQVTLFEYFFNCGDLDLKYVNQKLQESVLRAVDKTYGAGAVLGVSEYGMVSLRVPFGSRKRFRNVAIDAKEVVVAPLDLGYVKLYKSPEPDPDLEEDLGPTWAYMARVPSRQWKVGITKRNIRCSSGLANVDLERTLSERWSKADYYPTFSEALAKVKVMIDNRPVIARERDRREGPATTQPWSKDFAIVPTVMDSRPIVMFRDICVGGIVDGEIYFTDRYSYLKEEAIRTGANVHA